MKSRSSGTTRLSQNNNYSIGETLKDNNTAVITQHKISPIIEDLNHKMDEITKECKNLDIRKQT